MIATSLCNTYIELGINAYREGYNDIADTMLSAALEEAQRLSNREAPPCAVFNRLAHFYYQRGEIDRAERVYEAALELYQRIFSDDDATLCAMMLNLAELYFSRKKYDHALPLYERALAEREGANPVDARSAEKCLMKLAWIYCRVQRFDEAHAIYNRARLLKQERTPQLATA